VNNRNALLDTSPFVVLVVGSVDPDLLGSVQHLKQFAPEDKLILDDFLAGFRKIAITPHVATEAAHFLGKISDQRGRYLKARFVEILHAIQERSVTSRIAAARSEFAWLDLADCSLLEAGRPHDTLLSADAVLVYRRLELGLPAVNFNHLREQAGLL
jgi:hypothetical protein